MIELYKNIKNRRVEMDMSQQELADKVGYKSGKSMISKIENGEVDLTTSMIKEFAKALNTSPSDLMGWDDVEMKPETQELTLNSYKEESVYDSFLQNNPEYKVLFDAVPYVKKDDIPKALKAIELFTE